MKAYTTSPKALWPLRNGAAQQTWYSRLQDVFDGIATSETVKDLHREAQRIVIRPVPASN